MIISGFIRALTEYGVEFKLIIRCYSLFDEVFFFGGGGFVNLKVLPITKV